MAQIPVQMPLAQQPASADSLSTLTLLPASHVNDGDIVVLSGTNTIASAGANVANGIVGIAQHDSNSNYGGAATQLASSNATIFPSQVASGLFPSSPAGTIVCTLGSPVEVEINLTATTGWVTGGAQQASLTTAVGLAVDGVTGAYLADPTASNKVAVINGKPSGPLKGVAGDLGARVYITFNAAALAIQQGH